MKPLRQRVLEDIDIRGLNFQRLLLSPVSPNLKGPQLPF